MNKTLYVETEMNDIPVIDYVILSLQAQGSFGASSSHAAGLGKVIKCDYFGSDKTSFHVGMDLPRGFTSR